jgi:serine/threonine protein kinase
MVFAPDIFTGRRFGRYDVICRLAVGGSAEIFLGSARTGPFVGLPLVLKRMLASKDDIDALSSLIEEAKVTASLSHPNIARIYDMTVTQDDVVLVMEFIPGATLSEVRREAKKRKQRVPLGFAFKTISDGLLGLHHAHVHRDTKGKPKPVVHRDVTPGNLMIDFRGDCRLLDFGIARFVGGQRMTATDMVRGTAAYMSPEQIRNETLDFRSDLFSMGSVLYELITGEVAFGRSTDSEELDAILDNAMVPPAMRVPSLPLWVDGLVMKAMDPVPEHRFATALKFRDALLERAKGDVWTAHQCADFLRQDFAAREDSIEKLLEQMRTSDDEPTNPMGMKDPSRPHEHTGTRKKTTGSRPRKTGRQR